MVPLPESLDSRSIKIASGLPVLLIQNPTRQQLNDFANFSAALKADQKARKLPPITTESTQKEPRHL